MKLGQTRLKRRPSTLLARKSKSVAKTHPAAPKGAVACSSNPYLVSETFTIQTGKRPHLGMAKNTFTRAPNFDQPLPEFQQYR